MRSLEVRAVL